MTSLVVSVRVSSLRLQNHHFLPFRQRARATTPPAAKLTDPGLYQPEPLLDLSQLSHSWQQRDKVVFIMGATGTGKSRLSVDLANRFPAEIVNSDKMQVYRGLEIVTNKISSEEQCGVPHHLLGIAEPEEDFSPADFCEAVSGIVQSIIAREKVPIIVGGSNSYIEALVDSSQFDCCFIWVDVSGPVLHRFVADRVDKMVEAGMVEEAETMFDPTRNYDRGIRRAIGLPEFHAYFGSKTTSDQNIQTKLLREAIEAVKENTCKLACRQTEKIYRLKNAKGWNIQRVDATEAFRRRGREAWMETVEGPSSRIVAKFIYDILPPVQLSSTAPGIKALAAATH